MKEKWVIQNKKADFKALGARFGLDQLTVRLLVNRGADTEEKISRYLYGTPADLYDPVLMKDAQKAAYLLAEALRSGERIAVASDYDCDGIFSGWILKKALEALGGTVKVLTPDRMTEGYGLNTRIVDDALAFGAGLLLTCDNGISAGAAVSYARSLGMKVVVTDHHEVPRGTDEDGTETDILPEADAVVDPKRSDCPYPFKDLCGAAVAWKLMQLLYRTLDKDERQLDGLLAFAAVATVADVMDLTEENRIIVREGLKLLSDRPLPGIRALREVCGLSARKLTAYHLGFVLGPCFNAAGRLETVEDVYRLLSAESEDEARPLAEKLRELNETRKKLTAEGLALAKEEIAAQGTPVKDVLVVYLPDCHESVAGIIAGRLKEIWHRPAFVITGTGDICKGSGRSIEAYPMFERLSECASLLTRFGGHPMAAGFSLPKDNISAFRDQLNANSRLTDDDFCPIIRLDAAMPPSYASEKLIREMELLEPCGRGNERPLFGRGDLILRDAKVIGASGNAVRVRFEDESGTVSEGIWFGDSRELERRIEEACGPKAFTALTRRQFGIPAALTYVPELDEYGGMTRIRFVVRNIVPKR